MTCSPEPPGGFAATVVIVTKNRPDDAVRAVESALTQEGAVEVLVICDGLDDGAATRLSELFASRISVYVADVSRGYIVRRNNAALLARAPVLVSIDDDSVFTQPDTVSSVLVTLQHESVAAVAMPYKDVLVGGRVLQQGDDRLLMASERYTGTAHAIVRADFLRHGGYREPFVHQGEEVDLCIRLLNAGRLTVLGTSPPIHHYYSPIRVSGRAMYFGRQNDVLFAAWNVPWPFLPLHLIATTIQGVLTGLRTDQPRRALAGLARGYALALRRRDLREPVSVRTYRLSRRLRKRGPLPASQAMSRLAGPTPVPGA